ncbi:hypothetical protein RB594_004506 [Gaeumannomyces avenae]
MARGNQRDKAREKNLKEQAKKAGNGKSGSEIARDKEKVAEMMRLKQVAADAKKKETAK